MVAVIKTGHSILRLLNYNEHKVKAGVARCIGAENYPMAAADMLFHEKFNRLKNQASLNENVSRNSIHISLNFDPSELLSDTILLEIAGDYMKGVGMDDLPYLIYQHLDAGHPHIHIVSVKIREDGRRVETQNIGRNQSERTRREIERRYGLMKAEESLQRQTFSLQPVSIQRVIYGKSATKQAIGNVLNVVLKNYRFSSLPELNAVLRQFNVVADRGSEDSRIFKHQGLVYRVINHDGVPMGMPIKSSDFYNKPGLKFLQEKYLANEPEKQQYKSRVRNAIDLAFLNNRLDIRGLDAVLKHNGIDTLLRVNADGVIYGITYVDHESKCVFNGSSLGKNYSAKAIQERCSRIVAGDRKTDVAVKEKLQVNMHTDDIRLGTGTAEIAGTLLEPGYQPETMDWQLKGRKKKSKVRRLSQD